MRKHLFLLTIVFALLISSACTRSANAPPLVTAPARTPLPTLTATPDMVATIQALQAKLAAQTTQAAAGGGQLPTQAVTVTATPALVFADQNLTDPKEIEDARWVVGNSVMEARSEEPLIFAKEEANTRAEMTLAIARLCIYEAVGDLDEPIGKFTDLRLNNAEEKLLATLSEELVRRGLYLLRDSRRSNLSMHTSWLTAPEANTWIKMALESPQCGPQPTPTTTAVSAEHSASGKVLACPILYAMVNGRLMQYACPAGYTYDASQDICWKCLNGIGSPGGGPISECRYYTGQGWVCDEGTSPWCKQDDTPEPPPPQPTNTPAPPTNTPVPPTSTPLPPTDAPSGPGGPDKKEPTKTPTSGGIRMCPAGVTTGLCYLTRIQLAGLLHPAFADAVEANPLPPMP